MELRRGQFGRGKDNKLLGIHFAKKWPDRKTYTEENKESNDSNEETWSIRDRMFKESYEKRMRMFEALVESVELYGAEIWGWEKETRMDVIKRRYMKWILGLNKCTLNYIVTEEMKEEEITGKAIRRVIKYEEKTRTSNKKMVTECLREMEREKRKGTLNRQKEKREKMRGRLKMGGEEMERIREEEEIGKRGIDRKIKEKVGDRKREQKKKNRRIKI